MKNGDYILVIAPENYPGKKYRGRYCYEHVLVAWIKYGRLPAIGEEVHHVNENKHDNDPSNVEIITSVEHKKLHGVKRAVEQIKIVCAYCEIEFEMPPNKYRSAIKTGQTIHCSRSCAVRDQHRKGLVNLVGRYGKVSAGI
jgi:hypothetical protein